MQPWQRLDAASDDEAEALLVMCCGSSRWVERMMARRPFGSDARLVTAARDEWFALAPADWLEAFARHPRIGDRDALAARFPDTHALSEAEQHRVTGAGRDVLDALAAGNREYEATFGYTFIVSATGKSAAEMLGLLRQRLRNDPAQELHVAAAEQAQITARRLNAMGGG